MRGHLILRLETFPQDGGTRPAPGDACVVDQYGAAGVSAQHLCDSPTIRLGGQVGSHGRDGTPGIVGEARRQRFKPCSVAGAEAQIMPALCQPIGIERADMPEEAPVISAVPCEPSLISFGHLSLSYRIANRRGRV